MEIDTQNIDREIIETREKQQSLHSEKGRDMQDSNQKYFFGCGHFRLVKNKLRPPKNRERPGFPVTGVTDFRPDF